MTGPSEDRALPQPLMARMTVRSRSSCPAAPGWEGLADAQWLDGPVLWRAIRRAAGRVVRRRARRWPGDSRQPLSAPEIPRNQRPRRDVVARERREPVERDRLGRSRDDPRAA